MQMLANVDTSDTVSIYFSTGDFVDVLRRYREGIGQTYQTHNEIARLIHELRAAAWRVKIHSLMTPRRVIERPFDGVEVISLGAKHYGASELLVDALSEDKASAIIAHFANIELLRTIAAKNCRAMSLMGHSYNRRGIGPFLERRKVVSALNNSRFELVSNHCRPATEHFARIGVRRDKLIAWDIPHPSNPNSANSKELSVGRRFEIVYVGSISEAKGIGELIRAVALLRRGGMDVRCSLAGNGKIEKMKALGASLGISPLVAFKGVVDNSQVVKMMAEADLVVVPSRTEFSEGFPLTMFEAIASRTPIVCSDHPMFRSIIVDGQNASVFRAGDPLSFADAIQRTLTDRKLYASLSANAHLTWAALQGPADWRTLVFKWITEGRGSPWIRERLLSAERGSGRE